MISNVRNNMVPKRCSPSLHVLMLVLSKLQKVFFRLGSVGLGTRISLRAHFSGHTRGIHIGSKVQIGRNASFSCDTASSKIVVGNLVLIHPSVMLVTGKDGSITIGDNSTVNPFSVLYGHGTLTIGAYVRIAAHTVMIPANHRFDDRSIPIALQGLRLQGIEIGADSWIGAGVRVLDGVSIGCGSVVGAGSIVTKSLPSYSVAVGVPARIIGKRGDKEDGMHEAHN